MTSPGLAQHSDLLAFDSGGKVGVGEFNFDTLTASEKRVFPGRLDSFYSVNSPGFTSRSGPTALPGDTDLDWDFLPMTVDSGLHDGYASTLLYWDGVGADPLFGPTPTDDYRFSLFGKDGAAAAGGADQLVPGYTVETTGPNGSMHEHRFFFLDDNGDGMNTTLPQAGIYLFAMQLRVAGLETSDPFFYVWATPETSVLSAIQPAVAWVNARVDTLAAIDEPLPGDFNLDGVVNAADYTVWRDDTGTTYSTNDYDVWVENYGATKSLLASLAIPEPSSGALIVGTIVAGLMRRRLA
ncbi:hypothetical protein [Botrimarina colliarenosi]|uniref:hypothetical protein n=1 Tax=Botrimarina colliarenosi TaxID=2528001 RepID=UPI0018D4A218|nr:hypothetical protein [Botrimarina colliarenosi]